LLFVGTEKGVSYSPDDGSTWKELRLNLPTVAVHDLVVKDDDSSVGTHGRSIWILDDLTPLRSGRRRWSGGRPPLHGPSGRALALRRSRLVAGQGSRPEPPVGAVLHYC